MVKKIEEMDREELTRFCNGLARLIIEQLPPGPSAQGKCLFVLLFTQTTEPGTCQYVSNANRKDIIKFLRESADRLERKEDNPR